MKKYSSYILMMLITFLVVVISMNGFGPLDNLQQSIDDMLAKITASDELDNNIVIVSVDGRTQDEFGQWPWNYDLIADLMAATANQEPKVLAVDFIINEDGYQDSAGYTEILAGQMTWMKNVLMPYDIALTSFRDNRTNNPKHLFDNSVTIDNPLGLMDEHSSLLVRKVFLPPDKLLNTKPYLGFDYIMPDGDRIVRHHSTVMNFEGYYYPSFELAAAALYLDVPLDQVKFIENEKIEVGSKREIPINSASEYYIHFPQQASITKVSALNILTEEFDKTLLKDKLVLINIEDMSQSRSFKTTENDQSTNTYIRASVIQNIINNDILKVKTDNAMINLIVLFLIGGIAAFILPTVSALYRYIILFGSLFLLANVNYFLFSSYMIVPSTVYIAFELILFMIAAPFIDSELLTGDVKAESKIARPPKADKAKEEFLKEFDEDSAPVRELKDSPNDTNNVKTAMIDKKESSGELDSTTANDSSEVVDKTSAFDSGDVKESSEPQIIGPESFSNSDKSEIDNYGAISLDEEVVEEEQELEVSELKQLGRYQIHGTLGKGAMGHVYKGVDPAINRPVALKTIRLDFVNDPDEMEELKERLFREAQAAGKLSHPNIVTIYDVGSEGHLQYIAMEYLEGKTLEDMIKKKMKFNFKIIAKVIMQICDALDYAHEKGIVHRDIKPANIMIQNDYRVKLMDYGIARIDSNSMTKTGIAMGTPNYISPEQLKGQSVDKRADLFSLGVVIYELLLGKRPFKGENITSLIYSILNSDPEKPSNLNPQIPLLFDHVISRALKKEPGERYQKASDLKNDLADFVESFTIK
ncbi:MAG: CHASE2 domain-containing protein [Calditrichaeota bacterium]|nr:MAG: CHASE2 domain-containing protein [Calditrichota bacterium]